MSRPCKALAISLALLLIIAVLGLVALSQRASSSVVPQVATPQPSWADRRSAFDVSVRIADIPLPRDLSVQVHPDELGHMNVVSIYNDNTSPLYLLGPRYTPDDSVVPADIGSALPSDLAPLWMITADTALVWVRDPDWIWRPATAEEFDPQQGLEIYVAWGNLHTATRTVAYFTDVQFPVDTYPQFTTPEPQDARLSIVYEGDLIEIPVLLSFPVNPHYDPKTAVESRTCLDPCQLAVFGACSIPLVAAAIILVTLALCLRSTIRSRQGGSRAETVN